MKQLGTAIAVLTAITFVWVIQIFAQESVPKYDANTRLDTNIAVPPLSDQQLDIASTGYYYVVADQNNNSQLLAETRTLQVILIDKSGKPHTLPIILKPISKNDGSMKVALNSYPFDVDGE